MLTSEERVEELHRRMAVMKDMKNRREYRIKTAAAAALCLAIAVMIALAVGRLPVIQPQSEAGIAAASIFAGTVFGYILVAILAFCLGALVTIFCFRLKRRMDEEEKERK